MPNKDWDQMTVEEKIESLRIKDMHRDGEIRRLEMKVDEIGNAVVQLERDMATLKKER